EQIAARCTRTDARLTKQPLELGGGEVRVHHETRELADPAAVTHKFGASCRRAPVLPDNGAPNGGARRPVPEQDRLALVGHADRCGHGASRGDGLARCLERAANEILRVVLHPPRLREVLWDLPISSTRDATIHPAHEASRAGGALINRQDECHET